MPVCPSGGRFGVGTKERYLMHTCAKFEVDSIINLFKRY